MKKLFLTSSGLSAFPDFISQNPKTVHIGFIQTAADLYTDKWFVEKDRKFLLNKGYNVTEVDLKDRNQHKILSSSDVIYIAGGNTFYLLEIAIETDALRLIKDLVNKGKIYAGGSAGAVFAGPTIEPVALLDDPNDAPNLKTYESLNLVNFVVLPHYGNEKHREKYQKIIDDFKNREFKLITLTDEQAIIVEGDNYQIVESK